MSQRQVVVHRAKPKETRIQNQIIWDDDLSPMGRFVLIAMLSLPDSWDYSIRGMAALLHISKDTMSKYIRELESVGYLRRTQSHSQAGQFSSAIYILTDTPGEYGEPDPEPCPKKSDTGDKNDAPCPNLPAPVLSAPEKSPQKKRTEKKKRTEQQPPIVPQEGDLSEVLFERFWSAYPKIRHQKKKDAKKAWDKLNPDIQLCRQMAVALEAQKRSEEWTREGGRYIPMPATWIRGERWTDEISIPEPPPSPPGRRYVRTEIVDGEEVDIYE